MNNIESFKKLNTIKKNLFNELGKVIIGQEKVLEQLFLGMLCNGHVIIEGVPGLAKTLIIKSIAKTMELKFQRIQFTPDLMPSDITGTEIIQEDPETGKRTFNFFEGPLFANLILADEINRTPPKTQAALLQAMEEYHITVNGKFYDLEKPFFVMATQNPIEQEGTYPLPEAQLDRFMFNLLIDYPKFKEELKVVKNYTSNNTIKPNVIINATDLLEFQKLVLNVPISENVIHYAVKLIASTRPTNKEIAKITKKYISWGAGPRASSHLILATKAHCLLNEKTTPEIADVHEVIKPILRHRIITNFSAETDGLSKDDIIDNLISEMNN